MQAIEWAYSNGLAKSAIIKSSSPAVLWNKKKHIYNVENKWTTNEIKKFQSTINELTKDVFDVVLGITGVERELALTISQFAYHFQNIIYKACCLEEADFTDSRLFIYADGKTGPAGNIMNSPWDKLLQGNPFFFRVNYALKNDKWEVLTTHGVSYWRRFKVAGYETIVYRLAVKLMKNIPKRIFTKELLMPNENELNIEIAAYLASRGVKITKVQPLPLPGIENMTLDKNTMEIYKVFLPIMRKRIEQWVTPSAVEPTIALFKSYLEKELKKFKQLADGWGTAIKKTNRINSVVLMNSPANINGLALSYICNKRGIPLISSQHGVTVEISKMHNIMAHSRLDNSVADIIFSYNTKIVEIEKNTYFNKSKHYIVGMPMRIIRMKHAQNIDKFVPPIVYISTNLYKMGFSISSKTDYNNAKDEYDLVTNTLSKLPHKICYKTYPEDNRRYADPDPVLRYVMASQNMEIFSEKIDMRYLIPNYRIFITSQATSTLGWPIMSRRPVVFINKKDNFPLSDDAYEKLSQGIFVFNDYDKGFYSNLRDFLSQPLDEIEKLWKEKERAREEMIKSYFSTYKCGAGKRSAQIILKKYLV